MSTSFDQLKCLLTRAPVLAYPDFEHDFIPVSIPDFLVSPPPTLSSKLSIRLAILPASSNRRSAVLSIIPLSSTLLLLFVDGGCQPSSLSASSTSRSGQVHPFRTRLSLASLLVFRGEYPFLQVIGIHNACAGIVGLGGIVVSLRNWSRS